VTSAGPQLRLLQLQQRIGYEFRDKTLLQLALTHRSAAKENNERLEFLGDSLVNHVVAERLFTQFPEAREGQLSRLRAKLVRGSYLAEIANQLDIGSCLILGTGERKGGGRHRSSILADALEALVGAIFLDAGFTAARDTLMVWFADSFQGLTLSDERDAKTRLQEWLQGRGFDLPTYQLVDVQGADHEQCFFVHCHVAPLQEPVVGQGKSRRQAEQDAAKGTLEQLDDE